MYNLLTSIAGFLLVMGVVVTIHEWGHFIVARLCGMKVHAFAFGFGKILWSKTVNGVNYRICLWPLGGYVQIAGMGGDHDENDKGSYFSKPRWMRILVALAGPAMNFVLAFLLLWTVFFFNKDVVENRSQPFFVKEVVAGSLASQAGIQSGDQIISVGVLPTPYMNYLQAATFILSGVEEKEVVVVRNGTEIKLSVGKGRPLGVVLEQKPEEGRVPTSTISFAANETYLLTTYTFVATGELFLGNIPVKESISGPITIGTQSGEMLRSGIVSLMFFAALVSVSLGVMNLLPIPILDGGHVLLASIEAIRRKDFSEKARERFGMIGLLFVYALMGTAIFYDIVRLFE